LWDTGATHSVVTKATANKIGLKPIRKAIIYHAGGQERVNVYLVNIFLPNNICVPNVNVSECADTVGHFGVIVGMNIITEGDFAMTNPEGKTIFSFRMPSIEKIDFMMKK